MYRYIWDKNLEAESHTCPLHVKRTLSALGWKEKGKGTDSDSLQSHWDWESGWPDAREKITALEGTTDSCT